MPYIYLDNNSTTKIDPRVLEAMMPYLTEIYGNASSVHSLGIALQTPIKDARNSVAKLIGCESEEITFTSGATESINLALKGLIDFNRNKRNHIITAQTEHSAVLDTCLYLEEIGYDVTYLPVDVTGMISLNNLENTLREDTLLVCVMLANNETGVIQPIQQMAELAHSRGALFMSDATQAVGKIPVQVKELDVDLLAFSGHKFYAPKGIGGLFVKRGVKISPILHGGKHEKGRRSGTLNVPGIIGLGKAADIALQNMEADASRIKSLRDYLESELLTIENTILNGLKTNRLYNVSNICFKGVDADVIISSLKDIAVSNGSACTSTVIEPSYVLKAMGLPNEDAFASIRFSLGRFNTEDEINLAISEIKDLINQLRTSP